MTNLTFDEIIFKTSHNSYERKESLSEQLTFISISPYDCGCMGLEFDIWRHSSPYVSFQSIDNRYFTVAHTTPGKTTLNYYLSKILDWHIVNPDHDVVLITLDIKSSHGGYNDFHKEIDTYLKCYFKEDIIFKPAQLMKDLTLSLCENVIKTGWPSISKMKNKFIFCLSGNKKWKEEYAKSNLVERYCFSDKDMSASDKGILPPGNGNIVFFNFHIYNNLKEVWMKTIPKFSNEKLITRAFVANSEENWKNCIISNVSAIATNKISNYEWCKVSNSNHYRKKS